MLALLLVAGSLGLNNLAASIAIGLSGVDRATRTRTALAFGLFEAGMPVVGLLIGRQLSHALGRTANVVGGLLLIAVGVRVTISAVRSGDDSAPAVAVVQMRNLIVLAAALSIDNLVVGFALGAVRTPLVLSVAVIAIVSVGLSLLGLELGARLGARIEHRGELLSGIVLIGVGLAILTGVL